MRRTTLRPGNGAAKSSGPIKPNANLVTLTSTPILRRGAAVSLAVRGDARAPYVLFFALATTSATTAIAVEPIWLQNAIPLSIGSLDGQGNRALSYVVPNQAALEHATVWVQAVSGAALPLRATTLAGGVIR